MILQFRKTGNYIDDWKSFKEIEEELDIRKNSIKLVCGGKSKTAGGFVWKYDTDPILKTMPIDSMDLKYYIRRGTIRSNVKKGKEPQMSKIVNQYYPDGEFIKAWENAFTASKALHIQQSGIGRVCKGELKTSGGCIWRYKESDLSIKIEPNKGGVMVYQYSSTGEFIKRWPSATCVQSELGINRTSIGRVCEGKAISAGGYIWDYDKRVIRPVLVINKPINQYTFKDVFIREWKSAATVEKELGYKRSNVGVACKSNGLKKAYGFLWRYK